MSTLAQSIEVLLFSSAEEQSFQALASRLSCAVEEVQGAISELQEQYKDHGLMVLVHDNTALLVSRPEHMALLEQVRKEELSKELSKASAETLAIVAYWPGVSKAEIEFIRGVNASYSLRSLLMRGLIETKGAGRNVTYAPTISMLQHFGVTDITELPEYAATKEKLQAVMRKEEAI